MTSAFIHWEALLSDICYNSKVKVTKKGWSGFSRGWLRWNLPIPAAAFVVFFGNCGTH